MPASVWKHHLQSHGTLENLGHIFLRLQRSGSLSVMEAPASDVSSRRSVFSNAGGQGSGRGSRMGGFSLGRSSDLDGGDPPSEWWKHRRVPSTYQYRSGRGASYFDESPGGEKGGGGGSGSWGGDLNSWRSRRLDRGFSRMSGASARGDVLASLRGCCSRGEGAGVGSSSAGGNSGGGAASRGQPPGETATPVSTPIARHSASGRDRDEGAGSGGVAGAQPTRRPDVRTPASAPGSRRASLDLKLHPASSASSSAPREKRFAPCATNGDEVAAFDGDRRAIMRPGFGGFVDMAPATDESSDKDGGVSVGSSCPSFSARDLLSGKHGRGSSFPPPGEGGARNSGSISPRPRPAKRAATDAAAVAAEVKDGTAAANDVPAPASSAVVAGDAAAPAQAQTLETHFGGSPPCAQAWRIQQEGQEAPAAGVERAGPGGGCPGDARSTGGGVPLAVQGVSGAGDGDGDGGGGGVGDGIDSPEISPSSAPANRKQPLFGSAYKAPPLKRADAGGSGVSWSTTNSRSSVLTNDGVNAIMGDEE